MEKGEKKYGKIKKKGSERMKLKVLGRPSDIQEIIFPLVDYMGEKLRIIIESCPIVKNEPRRFYVEVDTKKNTESKM